MKRIFPPLLTSLLQPTALGWRTENNTIAKDQPTIKMRTGGGFAATIRPLKYPNFVA